MVSNRGLALLVIVAAVFSISAQFISIFWLDQARPSQTMPTAFATTGSGEVKLNITSSTDISVQNATVDFGAGLVNASICAYANLSNNGSGFNLPNSASNSIGCWVNTTTGPSAEVPAPSTKIVIQNDGSRNVSVTLTSAQGNAASFVGNCTTEDHGQYKFAVNSNESADGDAESTCPGSERTSAWTNISGAAQDVCTRLNYLDSYDAVNVVFNLTICRSTDQAGSINDTLTFTSAAA